MKHKASHRDYMQFGFALMEVLHKHYRGSELSPRKSGRIYQTLNVVGNICFEFRKWGDKLFYLILFRGTRYLFELDLSRVILEEGRYSWHLARPSNAKNRTLLKRLLHWRNELETSYLGQIRKIKHVLSAGWRVENGGFIFLKKTTYHELKDKLVELMEQVVSLHFALKPTRTRKPYDLDDARALEGYQSDKRYLHTKRNEAIVLKCKLRDDYKCQVCHFRLNINGRFVIECHHMRPLSGGETRVTKLNELVCLCPTCHRISHTQDPPLSLEEMRALLKHSTRRKAGNRA